MLKFRQKVYLKHWYLKPIFCLIPSTRKFRFQVPDPLLTETGVEIELALGITKISLILLNLILHSISDQYLENHDQAPEYKSSHFSNLLWSWMDGIIYKGYKQPLVQSDVPKHPHYLNVSKVLYKLKNVYAGFFFIFWLIFAR